MKKVILLFSGGLDSTFLAIKLLHEGWKVQPFSWPGNIINSSYTLIWNFVEKSTEHKQYWLAPKTLFYNAPPKYKNQLSHEMIGRNFLFLSKAIELALEENAKAIAIGAYEHTKIDAQHMADGSQQFCDKLRQIMQISKIPLELITLRKYGNSKARIIEEACFKYNCYREELIQTVRFCLNYDETPHEWGHGCGKCAACKNMKNACSKF